MGNKPGRPPFDGKAHRTASSLASHDAVDHGNGRTSDVSGKRLVDMMELLKRGRGPDARWRRDFLGVEGAVEGDDQVSSSIFSMLFDRSRK